MASDPYYYSYNPYHFCWSICHYVSLCTCEVLFYNKLWCNMLYSKTYSYFSIIPNISQILYRVWLVLLDYNNTLQDDIFFYMYRVICIYFVIIIVIASLFIRLPITSFSSSIFSVRFINKICINQKIEVQPW